MGSYRSEDRRKVDERGRRRQPVVPSGLTPVDFRATLGEPLLQAFRFIRAQIEHDPSFEHVWPKAGRLPTVLRGFVVSTQQLHDSARRLLSRDAVSQLVMPAAILERAMLEGLGNVLLLTQDPSVWMPRFRKDCYRTEARATNYLRTLRPTSAVQADRDRRLVAFADALGLTEEERSNPESIVEWPMPGEMVGRRRGTRSTAPLLLGERLLVFRQLHSLWYSELSSLAHHRLATLQVAVSTEEQPDEEMFARTWNEVVTFATLVPVCILSEVEAHLAVAACAPLRPIWKVLRDLHDTAKEVFEGRYRRLLRMPEEPQQT